MIYFVVSIIILGFALTIYFLNRRLKDFEERQKSDQSMLMLNQNLQGMQKTINERLDRAAQVIMAVNKELGQVQEMGRNMKELQDFLRSPKLRGNIGEQILKDLLEQYFPRPHFEMQYKFDENTKVDAVIKTNQGLIPIDSKLPMENFQKMVKAELETERAAYRKDFLRDVKKHISDISKKYILPAQGTMDFAIMYIPSETVYYEIIREHTDLTNYSYEQKVYPVSPNSFYFFLQSILKMMEGEVIQEAAKKIIEMLSAIQRDATKFGETLSVATTHISNAKNAIDRVNNEYAKLTGKIDQVRLLK